MSEVSQEYNDAAGQHVEFRRLTALVLFHLQGSRSQERGSMVVYEAQVAANTQDIYGSEVGLTVQQTIFADNSGDPPLFSVEYEESETTWQDYGGLVCRQELARETLHDPDSMHLDSLYELLQRANRYNPKFARLIPTPQETDQGIIMVNRLRILRQAGSKCNRS